ncbi:hypothetical protein AgCh_008056 [Apium graveolens]
MSQNSKFVVERGDSSSNGSEDTFRGLGPHYHLTVPLSNSGTISPFGMGFDEDSLGKGEVVGGSVNIEGTDDSPSAFDSDMGVMVLDNREKFFKSQKPYNGPSIYHKAALNLGVLSGYCSFSNGYSAYPPSHRDRMWDPPRTGAHVHFDAKSGCPTLVITPTSNKGWHSKWARYEGHELAKVAPWSRLSSDNLNIWSETGFSGPKLRVLVKPSQKMPSDSILKLLVNKKPCVGVFGVEGSTYTGSNRLEKLSNEGDASDSVAGLGVTEKGSQGDTVVKEKKRHREHISSALNITGNTGNLVGLLSRIAIGCLRS